MATKSILKSVNIKSNSGARRLVTALEQSKNKSAGSVMQSRKYENAGSDEIRKMFGSKDK